MRICIRNLCAPLFFTILMVHGNTLLANPLEPKHNSMLTGPYLGQKPPGLTPEVFAPDIISTSGWEYGVVFAPTMKQMYYLREIIVDAKPQQQFVVFELTEQEEDEPAVWIERVISNRVGTPTLSPDNKTLFFGRSYKTQTKNGWSEMQRLGPDFEDLRIMRVSASLNGTLAFDEASTNGFLRYSTLENGKRKNPKPFPRQINTGKWNAHPFIAPDESYVIWDGQRDSETRNSDLFISFKQQDGSWGEAIKFDESINTETNEFASQVTPDGKYLFFNRKVGEGNIDTFWIDAKVIEQVKPAHIKQYQASQAPVGTPALAVGNLSKIPVLPEAFIDTTPVSFDSALKTNKLALPADKTSAIVKFAEQIGTGKYGRYDSLLIAHKGKLVFESYHQRGRYNLPHPQASATKGITSLLLGRAMQLGYLNIDDLHKPLIDFLPKVNRAKLTKGAETITLHKALTMHGGLGVTEEAWQLLEKTPEALQGQKLVQSLLENSAPITNESQVYKYGNYNPMLVMAVLDAVVPGSAQTFIKSELLDKLNIRQYTWQDHVSGLPQAGWMVSLTSRDMIKLGNIVAQNGMWQGTQFIHPEYLKQATSSLVQPTEDWMPAEYRYGYFWYTQPINLNNKTLDITLAWGGGGQRIIAVPELELAIALTGHDRDDNIMQQINSIVIPAFTELWQ